MKKTDVTKEKQKLQSDPDCREVVFGGEKMILIINNQKMSLHWFVFLDGDKYAFKIDEHMLTNLTDTETKMLQFLYVPDNDILYSNVNGQKLYHQNNDVSEREKFFFAFAMPGYAEFVGVNGEYSGEMLFHSTKLQKRLSAFLQEVLMLVSAYNHDVTNKIREELTGGNVK